MEQGNGEVKLMGVKLKIVGEELEPKGDPKENLDLIATCGLNGCQVLLNEGKQEVLSITVSDSSQLYRAGPKVLFLRCPQGSAIITTSIQTDATALLLFLEHESSKEVKTKKSTFSMRTEKSSSKLYFQYYGYLSQQQTMLQDYVRTSTYQSAMLMNTSNFKDKVVLDVGAGTGMLSFFALQAGARKVYSIEASNMAICCKNLIKKNNFEDKMEVIVGKVEEVDVPEKVDMIISEPMGYMLFNERMLETYLHAKKWLKEGGNMFPTKGILYVAPFNDEALYLEQFNKANFWTQSCFHGIDVSCLREESLQEYFEQPVKDTFDVRIITAEPVAHTTNFLESQESDLINITIPLEYKMWSSGMVHGLAFWFDCAFCGSESTVWLSTAPFQPVTHWYQIRLLLPKPMLLQKDQQMTGTLYMRANKKQSYDMTLELEVTGTEIKSESTYDLKNPYLRYMSTQPSVPSTLLANPTDSYFQANDTASNGATPVTNTDSAPSNVTIPAEKLTPTLDPSASPYVPLLESSGLPSASSGVLKTPSSGATSNRALYTVRGTYRPYF